MHLNQQDIVHYAVLIFGLVAFLISFAMFQYQPGTQLYIAFFGCVFYAGWGIGHHYTEGRLTKKIALEYILLALLIFSLIAVVLNV
jgi:hypothetical protein